MVADLLREHGGIELPGDVQVLVERGYKLESVKMLDMFPQTYHAELIGVLVG